MVSVDLRELRWAIIASRHKSLRRAAEALNVRQSTLCRTLHNLEARLDVVLFERKYGRTHPTPPGREFLDSAQRIIASIEEMTVRVKAQARGKSGRLIVGVHASPSAGNLRATLIEHHQRFPDVETVLIDKAAPLRSLGVEPVIVDVFEASAPAAAVAKARPDVVVHQLTDLPPGLDPARMADATARNARIREKAPAISSTPR